MNESQIISFVREMYETKDPIPLHEPSFIGNEQKYTKKAIDRLNPSIFKRIFIMPNLTTRISKRIKRDLDSIKKTLLKQKY